MCSVACVESVCEGVGPAAGGKGGESCWRRSAQGVGAAAGIAGPKRELGYLKADCFTTGQDEDNDLIEDDVDDHYVYIYLQDLYLFSFCYDQ